MQAHESLCLREGGLGTVLSLVKVEELQLLGAIASESRGEAAGLPKMRECSVGQGLGAAGACLPYTLNSEAEQ